MRFEYFLINALDHFRRSIRREPPNFAKGLRNFLTNICESVNSENEVQEAFFIIPWVIEVAII